MPEPLKAIAARDGNFWYIELQGIDGAVGQALTREGIQEAAEEIAAAWFDVELGTLTVNVDALTVTATEWLASQGIAG